MSWVFCSVFEFIVSLLHPKSSLYNAGAGLLLDILKIFSLRLWLVFLKLVRSRCCCPVSIWSVLCGAVSCVHWLFGRTLLLLHLASLCPLNDSSCGLPCSFHNSAYERAKVLKFSVTSSWLTFKPFLAFCVMFKKSLPNISSLRFSPVISLYCYLLYFSLWFMSRFCVGYGIKIKVYLQMISKWLSEFLSAVLVCLGRCNKVPQDEELKPQKSLPYIRDPVVAALVPPKPLS